MMGRDEYMYDAHRAAPAATSEAYLIAKLQMVSSGFQRMNADK
jgi:hypothetical protein